MTEILITGTVAFDLRIIVNLEDLRVTESGDIRETEDQNERVVE